jgi:hypothetical protein
MNDEERQGGMNHKQYITWREFSEYLLDYQDIETRNKDISRKPAQKKEKKVILPDEENEFKSLVEKEQARRVAELPMLRPGDVIDIPTEHLQILKDIFGSI